LKAILAIARIYRRCAAIAKLATFTRARPNVHSVTKCKSDTQAYDADKGRYVMRPILIAALFITLSVPAFAQSRGVTNQNIQFDSAGQRCGGQYSAPCKASPPTPAAQRTSQKKKNKS